MVVAGAPWQLECENVEKRCGYLLTSGLWSDCAFMVGSGSNQAVVPTHKLLLAMASPVFEAMFYGGLSECNQPIVPIPDVQPEAFRALLQYIYTGDINIDSFDMACELWLGADKYMLPHLVTKCKNYICSVVGPSNACRAYELAHLFDEKAVMDKCIQIISTNTKNVLSDSSFKDVELNTVITICSLEHLNVDSELDLFHAVARYAEAEQRRPGPISPPKVLLPSVESSSQTSPAVELNSKPTEVSKQTADKEDLKEEEPTIHTALQKIRFLSLSTQEFAEGPAHSHLLTKDESLAIFTNIASRDSPVPMPTGFSERRERRQPRSGSDGAWAAVNIMHGTGPNVQQALDKGILEAQGPALTVGNYKSRHESKHGEPLTIRRETAPRGPPSSAAELYQKYSPSNYVSLTQRLHLQQEQCFKPGSLEHTINALKCGSPSQEAAQAAGRILRDAPGDMQPALDKGILDALAPALTNGDEKCKNYAARAIYNLCTHGSPSQLDVLAASAALQPYCRLLAAERNTCCYVLRGLTYFLKKVEKNTKPALLQKLRALGVPQLLIPLKQHSDVENRDLANRLLRNHFGGGQNV